MLSRDAYAVPIMSLWIITGICKTRLRYHSSDHQVSAPFSTRVAAFDARLCSACRKLCPTNPFSCSMSDSFTDLLVHNLSIRAPPLPHACVVLPHTGGRYGGLSLRASRFFPTKKSSCCGSSAACAVGVRAPSCGQRLTRCSLLCLLTKEIIMSCQHFGGWR